MVTDTVFGNLETNDINNLSIQCDDGLFIDNYIEPSASIEDNCNEVQNNDMDVDSAENELDEDSLASRIHKDYFQSMLDQLNLSLII